MLLKIYSIRDSKTEIFNQPFFKRTPGEAERDFNRLVNDKETHPGQFPTDFELYELGEYDDVSGKMTSFETPKHIVKGVQLVNKTH